LFSAGTPGSALKRQRKPGATPGSVGGGAGAGRGRKTVPAKPPAAANPVVAPQIPPALPVSDFVMTLIFLKRKYRIGAFSASK